MQQPAAWMRKVVAVAVCGALAPACILDWEREDDGGGGGGGDGGSGLVATTSSAGGACVVNTNCSCTGCTSYGCDDKDPNECEMVCNGACTAMCSAGSCSITLTQGGDVACNLAGDCDVTVNGGTATVDCPEGGTCSVTANAGSVEMDCTNTQSCDLVCNAAMGTCSPANECDVVNNFGTCSAV
jgi:hypothetical protein